MIKCGLIIGHLKSIKTSDKLVSFSTFASHFHRTKNDYEHIFLPLKYKLIQLCVLITYINLSMKVSLPQQISLLSLYTRQYNLFLVWKFLTNIS